MSRTYSFSISDTMYAHDSCRSYADGIGTQAFGFANLFSLSQTDTLTGIEIGMMDMTGIAEQDFEMEVRIYAADTSTGMPGRLLLEETITRPLRGGLVAYDIPDRLLPAGHYLIALYQTGTDNIAIAYDIGFNSDDNAISVFDRDGKVADLDKAPKSVIASRLVDLIFEAVRKGA